MARRAKPWFRKARGAWFVTVEGVQHNLGADKKEAFERFYQLMRQPQRRVVSSQALVAVVDAFLDWVKINRSADTFEWYRYRLQRFCIAYRRRGRRMRSVNIARGLRFGVHVMHDFNHP